VAGSFEHGDKHSDPMKGGEVLHYLRDYQLLKDSAPWSNLFSYQDFQPAYLGGRAV
jgi:hypothetical protein